MRLLAGAAALIGLGWCQTGLALDQGGREVEPWAESACKWSPLGALLCIWFEESRGETDAFRAAYTALAVATGGRLEEWNAARWRTSRHVLNAFARARDYLPEARKHVQEVAPDHLDEAPSSTRDEHVAEPAPDELRAQLSGPQDHASGDARAESAQLEEQQQLV